MQILQNQSLLNRFSDLYIKGELSNVATVVQTPQQLVDYFHIDPDATPTMAGLRNIDDYIGPESHVIYDEITNLPISGINELVIQSTFDDEVGHEEDFQSEGIIFPNTIWPHENDFFIFQGDKTTALYVVTETSPVTVRSNPFIQINFRLYSRDPEMIKQLRKQVRKKYLTTVTAIGMDKTLVIEEEAYFTIEDHVKNYLDVLDLYSSLFYDYEHATFIYDGIVSEKDGYKYRFIDMVLWKIMFDNRLVIYDDIMTYAINNFNMNLDRLYASSPDLYVDPNTMKRSILYRILERNHKKQVDEYKFPQAFERDPRIGKFDGKFIYYFESYGKECDCNLMCNTCPVWDDDFMYRLKNNIKYEEEESMTQYISSPSCDCVTFVNGVELGDKNTNLRNAIISWYWNEDIDWENIKLVQTVTSENYFLIPILLYAYRDYIQSIQK